MKYKILFLILIIFIYGCSGSRVVINNNSIKVEIADTPEERSLGLMNRENICKDCGMLFIFENEDYHSFWMKNTLIQLDIIFISSDLTIVDVIQAKPCTKDPCEIYEPKAKAKYVLEVNRNYTTINKIKIGNRVKIIP